MDVWSRANLALSQSRAVIKQGTVTDVTGLIIEGNGPSVGVGTTCEVRIGERSVPAQVVGFKKDRVLLMPLGDISGIAPGALIISQDQGDSVAVSHQLLGRIIDPLGNPLDGGKNIAAEAEVPLMRMPPPALTRKRVSEPLDVGIKAVNGILTVGKGQRVAVMAGSGVGKSTFLGMLARNALSEVNVIALVGERGREVREFVERDLGPEGMARSVLVVATSDSSALMRIRAAMTATAVAEYFRDQGAAVTLMVDSITRFCMAQREVGLAIGEPPTTAGYTPSVFAMLPKLLERAGTCEGEGSITGFYTVLVEGDDMNEPIADAVRGIVDGHFVLSRSLASKGHYPAVEINQSLSRVMSDIVSPEHAEAARKLREILARYAEIEDLITIGAYKQGQNPQVDFAVSRIEYVRNFLKQRPSDKVDWQNSLQQLVQALSPGS